jgi:hypothetical protein
MADDQRNNPVYDGVSQSGSDCFSDTDPHEGRWCGFKALTTCVIAELKEADVVRSDFTGITVTVGTGMIFSGILGLFTKITLTSGEILMVRTT